MARTTLLDTVEPLTQLGQAVNAGIAFSRQWRLRSANERVVVDRVSRVLTLMQQGRLSDAARASGRVLDATSAVVSDIELVAYVESSTARINARRTSASASLLGARAYAGGLNGLAHLAGDPQLSDVSALTDAQVEGMVTAMCQLGSTNPEAVARSVRAQAQARVRGLHAHIVLTAARRRGSQFPAVTVTETPIRQRALALRDAARAAASGAADADAGCFAALADAVAAYEHEWTAEVGDACVGLLVAGSDESATLATRRRAALAYDAARLGLTWLAGCHELMLAWALDDGPALREWAARASLPLESGVLDLPRAELADVAGGSLVAGEAAEVAGVVTFAESELQGGRVRTVLRLDDTLTVYFPFSAVDGFGILPGVWCQARGTVLDESKGGFAAPTLGVRRRRLGEAAKAGFNDYLEYQGRGSFDRMRAGNDATTGRLAHDPRTANEAADWN